MDDPARCTKCGAYEDDPTAGSICMTYDTPDGYPEPNGEHEFAGAEVHA